jgi:glycosyltransferase involved in cell wall biosynthesis
MKVVFDCRYVRLDRHDGISRYTAELVTEFARLHPVIMLISDHRQLAMLPDLPWQRVRAPTSVREPLVALSVNRLHPDVVFSPMQTMGSWGRRYRLVLTVHDLIYYRNRTPPRELPAFVRVLWRLYHLAWWPQRMLLNRADGIVTVSETTRALMLAHRLTRRQITVVPNAAGALGDPRSNEPFVRRTSPDSTRLVYMGSFMPYKNVDALVRAAGALPGFELHLLSRITDEQRMRLQSLAPTARLVFHDGVSDPEYADILGSATALVTASRDEGFGIPLVEAMSLGIPVVVSDIPIFREIGGDAGLYCDPNDPLAFAAAVHVLEEPGEWARRSALAVDQAARYSWGGSARTLLRAITAAAATAQSPVRSE